MYSLHTLGSAWFVFTTLSRSFVRVSLHGADQTTHEHRRVGRGSGGQRAKTCVLLCSIDVKSRGSSSRRADHESSTWRLWGRQANVQCEYGVGDTVCVGLPLIEAVCITHWVTNAQGLETPQLLAVLHDETMNGIRIDLDNADVALTQRQRVLSTGLLVECTLG